MTEFKVGDKIRITPDWEYDHEDNPDTLVGREGLVVEILPDSRLFDYYVTIPEDISYLAVFKYEIERIGA